MPTSQRKTKIVATIGPASAKPEIIAKMIDAGLNVARLNFSHGTHESHRETVALIRKISQEKNKEIGILQDLSGPKIRLGAIKEQILSIGQTITLTCGAEQVDDSLPVNYPYLLDDVNIGDRILLADGIIELAITGKDAAKLTAKVVVGGPISSHKGVNMPQSNLQIKAFTDKDKADLNCGLELGVDFVAMSFVRHENDLAPIVEMMGRCGTPPLLIAKIEKPQAVERLEQILDVVGGIMVARGDLGVEMPIEEVPLTQKKLIQATRIRGKVVITATQMLGSMVRSPRPSRAEVTDVANAVLDGTDAVMLSDETAAGDYPVESVAMLDKVARQTEPMMDSDRFLHDTNKLSDAVGGAITKAVTVLADDLEAKAIVAATQSGGTARLISHLRPKTMIVGLTSNTRTYRQLTLSWGVVPALIEPCDSVLLVEQLASEWLVRNQIAQKGDRVFLTCGLPLQTSGTTNLIKLLDIGESC